MSHRIFVYDPNALSQDALRPIEIIETDDADKAMTVAGARANAAGLPGAVEISPDPSLCPDLETYTALLNFGANLVDAIGPNVGDWTTQFPDDLADWRQQGIETPAQLDALVREAACAG